MTFRQTYRFWQTCSFQPSKLSPAKSTDLRIQKTAEDEKNTPLIPAFNAVPARNKHKTIPQFLVSTIWYTGNAHSSYDTLSNFLQLTPDCTTKLAIKATRTIFVGTWSKHASELQNDKQTELTDRGIFIFSLS